MTWSLNRTFCEGSQNSFNFFTYATLTFKEHEKLYPVVLYHCIASVGQVKKIILFLTAGRAWRLFSSFSLQKRCGSFQDDDYDCNY